MKRRLVVGVLGLIVSLVILGGVSQASIMTVTAFNSSSSGITATLPGTQTILNLSEFKAYDLGTIKYTGSALSDGSLSWTVEIGGKSSILTQEFTVSGSRVTILDSSPVTDYGQVEDGVTWDAVYAIGNGFDLSELAAGVVVQGNFKDLPVATPEPATFIIWSLLGGLGVCFGWMRKRKAA